MSEEMSINVLVTGVGGGVGQSIIKALHHSSYTVVGVDSEELAAGLYAVSRGYKGEYANNPLFINRLLDIARAENCSFLLPGHDVELQTIAHHADQFRSQGVTPIVSNADTVALCDDKLETASFVASCGLSSPTTSDGVNAESMSYPIILKPRFGGARSKDTYVVRNHEELQRYKQLVDPENCVTQEYIDGDEYTCGTVNFDGKCHGCIVMRRTLRAGDTYKAFVEENETIEHAVRMAAEKLSPFGACNFQLKMRDGVPYIFEINARCSGTTASRALVGFNEPKMILDFLSQGTLPAYSIEPAVILRYWNELVVSYDTIDALRRGGSTSAPVRAL